MADCSVAGTPFDEGVQQPVGVKPPEGLLSAVGMPTGAGLRLPATAGIGQ